MANPELVSTPSPAITPAEVREQFKVTESAEDGLLALYIQGAEDYLEKWLRMTLAQKTWKYYLDEFPTKSAVIELPKPPLADVSVSINYYDTDGVSQTLVKDTDFQVDAISEPGRVKPMPGLSWPATELDRFHAVDIQYMAGWLTANIPEQYKQLLRWITATWFRNREPNAPVDLRSVPHTVEDFVGQLMVHRIG